MSRFISIALSVLLCYTTHVIAQSSSIQSFSSSSSTGVASSNQLPVGSSWNSTQCGGGVFDFTHVNRQVATQGTYLNNSIYPAPVFIVGLCSPVWNYLCDSIQPTSLCAFVWPPTTFENLGFWNTSLPRMYTITSQGVDILVEDHFNSCNITGQQSNNQTNNQSKPSRNLHYRLICTSEPYPDSVVVVSRLDQCNTEIVVYTSSACRQVFNPSINQSLNRSCGTGEFNFTSLSDEDISLTNPDDASSKYVLRPCGIVSRDADVLGMCHEVGASLCISSSESYNTYPLTMFNEYAMDQSINQPINHPVWKIFSYGVQMTQNSSNECRQRPGAQLITTILYLCVANATKPELLEFYFEYECTYHAVVGTSLACSSSPRPNNQTCGVAGFNLSSISHQDLSLTTYSSQTGSTSNLILRPCGVVSTDTTGKCQQFGASLCFPGRSRGETTVVSYYHDIEEPVWQAIPNGVMMTQTSSFTCSNDVLKMFKIVYLCNEVAFAPLFASYNDVDPCRPIAIVETSAACDRSIQITSSSTGASGPTTSVCGSNGFDFSSIVGHDLISFYSGTYYLYFSPCGIVSASTSLDCYLSRAMLCQVNQMNSQSSVLAFPDAPVWSTISDGLKMIVSGDWCDINPPRSRSNVLNVYYHCASYVSNIYSFREIESCVYEMHVYSNLVCDWNRLSSTGSQMLISSSSSSLVPSSTGGSGNNITCGSNGFDLSSLVGRELTYTVGSYVYYFSPCSVVRSQVYCYQAQAMLCQYQINTQYYMIAFQEDPIWSRITNGIQVVVPGEWCAPIAARRSTTIRYLCQSATSALIVSVTESSTCRYDMLVYTNLVCSDVSSTGSQMRISSSSSSSSSRSNSNYSTAVPSAAASSSGSQWIGSTGSNGSPGVCSGAGVDLSSIAMIELEWQYGEWTYYVHPCGAPVTSNAQCTSLGASVCQVHRSNHDVFALARQMGTWYVAEQGFSISFGDGDYCGAISSNRYMVTHYVCSSFTQIVSFTETSTCRYLTIIETPAACNIPMMNNTYYDGSFLSNQCGGGLLNLTYLSTTDLYLFDASTRHAIRPCGTVSYCPNGTPTSFCTVTGPYSISHSSPWDAAVPNRYNATRYGVDMIVSNYQYSADCTTFFHFVCSPSALVPQFVLVRSQGCMWKAVVRTSAVCSPSTQPALLQSCGGAGYNFSIISDIEVYWKTDFDTYYLHPCGQISDIFYSENKNYCSGSMFCRTSPNFTDYTAARLATWDQATITWVPSVLPGGPRVTEYVVSKQQCTSSLPYQIAIVFICDQYATSPQINVLSSATCTSIAYIRTSQACIRSVSPQVVDQNCGGSLYDFSSVDDLRWEDTYSVFYLNLCRPVLSASCSSLTPTSWCRVSKSTRTPDTLVRYNSTSTYMWHNKASVTMSIQSPVSIQSGINSGTSTAVNIVISCLNSTTSTSTGITSVVDGVDISAGLEWLIGATIRCDARYSSSSTGSSSSSPPLTVASSTSIASSSSSSFVFPSAPSFCGGAGYNVTQAASSDLSLTKAQFNFWLRPCGSVTTVTGCAGSILCQISGSTSLGLVSSNSFVSQNWLALPNGAQMTSVNTATGVSCLQTLIISFICNSTIASSAVLVDLSEVEQCMYVATVHTSSACHSVGPTVSNEVGVSFYSNRCGGGYYSLSSLVGHDFSFVDTSSTQTYFVRVCGQTSSLSCASVHPTSFCSVRASSGDATSVANWSNNATSLYTITQSGLDITVSTPGGCGLLAGYVVYHLVCNPLADVAILISVARVAPLALDCRAIATIHTSSVCTRHNETLPMIDVISSSSAAAAGLEDQDELNSASDLTAVSAIMASLVVAMGILIV